MAWGQYAPYLVPLLVLLVMYRRAGRVRRVRVGRLWIAPAIVLFASGTTLYYSGMPTFLWSCAYLIALVAGIAVGYLRTSHIHLSVHPETGEVQSQQTPIATAIIMGLFIVKLGLNAMFPQLNAGRRAAMTNFTPDTVEAVQQAQAAAHQASHTAAAVNYATDALLIFSTALLVTSAFETWMRADRLLAAHRGEVGEITSDD